jgi:hypothetical protein
MAVVIHYMDGTTATYEPKASNPLSSFFSNKLTIVDPGQGKAVDYIDIWVITEVKASAPAPIQPVSANYELKGRYEWSWEYGSPNKNVFKSGDFTSSGVYDADLTVPERKWLYKMTVSAREIELSLPQSAPKGSYINLYYIVPAYNGDYGFTVKVTFSDGTSETGYNEEDAFINVRLQYVSGGTVTVKSIELYPIYHYSE